MVARRTASPAVGVRLRAHVSAGRIVIPTGGHGSGDRAAQVDGPAGFRKAVRLEIQAGAEWIKISFSADSSATAVAIDVERVVLGVDVEAPR